MSDTIHIKPATPDMIVRDPGTFRALAADGEDKPRNQYWQRRLRDGDVVLVEQEGSETENGIAPQPSREA